MSRARIPARPLTSASGVWPRLLLVGAFTFAAMATGSAAQAQDAQTQAMGRALFNEGIVLFNEGKYDAACPKLEASLKAYPGLGTRGKLAECYEKLGRYASAWQAYREVAQLATRGGDPTREKVAAERAKALEPRLSYLTLILPPANDVSGMVIKRHGHDVDRAKLGAAEPVDSGVVPLEVTAPGRKTFTTQINVAEAQRVRFEIPALERSFAGPVAVAPVGSATPATAPSNPERAPASPYDEQSPPVHREPSSAQKPIGLVVMGAGVVAVGIGAYFGLDARSTYDGAFDSGGGCDRGSKSCDAAGQSSVDDARQKATVSTILFAAGGALAVGGLVLFLTAPSGQRTGLRLSPAPYAGGAGLVLGSSL